jgi:hypothetical protein
MWGFNILYTLVFFYATIIKVFLLTRVMQGYQPEKGEGQGMKQAPSSLADTGGATSTGDAKRGLIGLNNLTYRLEPDMSVAVNCTDKNHFFQQQKYSSRQRAVCVINSGADYVDPRRSFLCFTIELPEKPTGSGTYGVTTLGAKKWAEHITFGHPMSARSDGRQFVRERSENEFTEGSAINLIDRITISTRSGDELSRIERLNLLQYIINPWTRDDHWRHTVGAGMGMGRKFSPYEEDTNKLYRLREMRVAIPLYCLSGLFNYDKLLPAMLMSGLRVEIQWADAGSAFVRNPFQERRIAINERYVKEYYTDAGKQNDAVITSSACVHNMTPAADSRAPFVVKIGDKDVEYPLKSDEVNTILDIGDYTVKDIYFQMKSVQLTDSIQRVLNEISAVNGLEIVYSDFNNSQIVQTSAEGSMYMECRHAASRALRALLIPRAQILQTAQFADAFLPTQLLFRSWHFRLGALYFPHQPIKADTCFQNATQTYLYSLDAFGKIAGVSRSGCNFNEYQSEWEKFCVAGIGAATPVMQGAILADDVPNGALNRRLEFVPVPPNDRFFPLDNNHPSIIDATGNEDADQVNKNRTIQADKFQCNAPIAVSLERSSLFNLSGIPINNSRVLSFHGDFAASNDEIANVTYGVLTFDMYLQYVRLARVFLNNVEVEQ